jgi:hypothetical protein
MRRVASKMKGEWARKQPLTRLSSGAKAKQYGSATFRAPLTTRPRVVLVFSVSLVTGLAAHTAYTNDERG